MIFKRVTRAECETVFTVAYNAAGVPIPANSPVVLDTSAPDGVRVTQPTTETLSLFVGLAAQDIADRAYGLLQSYGFRATACVIVSDQPITAGDILIPIGGAWGLTRAGAGDGKSGFVVAVESVGSTVPPISANCKVFIRAL